MLKYKCDVCGRPMKNKIKLYGQCLCNKHYAQMKKYGKTLDTNPRTTLDRNEFHIVDNITYIDLYDSHYNVVAQAIIDTEDLEKVRYTKWKLSANGYAMNTPKFAGSNKHMSHEVLGTNDFVDHINHNKLDNRKCNLRIVTKSQNAMNSNHKGVFAQGGKFYAHIKLNQKAINLGAYIFEEEAFWARWYAEKILFKEYAFPKDEPFILDDRKQDIKEYIDKKVQRL